MSTSRFDSDIDFSGIDDTDAQTLLPLLQALPPRPEAGLPAGAGLSSSAGAGLSALVDQSLLASPGLPISSSSGSEHGVTMEDDERSIYCGDQLQDIEMGVMSEGSVMSCGLEVEVSDGEQAEGSSISGGLEVEGLDDHSQCAMVVGEADWVPGVNCGRWVAKATPLNEQACVFITNACLVASRLPKKILCAAAHHLRPGTRRLQKSAAWHLVSSLLCIDPSSVQRVLKCVKRNPSMWSPCVRRRRSVKAGLSASELACPPQNSGAGLSAAVRMAVSQVAEGRTAASYEREVMRNLMNGWTMEGPGGSKFQSEVAGLAAMVLAHMDAMDYDEPLPGLGIPSDFCMLADPVSIGEGKISRHGDLLVICLAMVSARTGRLYNPMLAAPQMKIGEHGGDKLADAMLQACLDHPAHWSTEDLRKRMSGVGGDGALCVGGPNARHKSSGAAEKIWNLVHNGGGGAAAAPALACPPHSVIPTCTSWDPFHRADVAMWRSVRKHPIVLSIFDVSREVDYLFGQSEGVLIFRGVAAEIGETGCNVRAPGGTRKVVYLSGVPGSLLQNYRIIRGGFHARVAWKQAGHSNQTINHLLDLGRRMSEPQFCIALTLLDDILGGLLQPFARQVQGLLEVSAFHKIQTQLLRKIDLYILSIRRMRILVRVMSLCRQHLTSAEAVRLCMAFGGISPCSTSSRIRTPRKMFKETHHGVSPRTWQKILRWRGSTEQFGIQPLKWGTVATHFPTFFKHIEGMLDKNPKFQSCELVLPSTFNASTHVFLGAHCQCASRETELLQQWEAFRLGRPCNRPKGPVWVAYQKGERAGLSAPESDDVPVSTPPRCITLPKMRSAPPQNHTQGMFRHRLPRCNISHREYLMDQAIDTALQSISAFLVTMKVELRNIFTSVGVNDSMSTLLGNVRACWDWQRLVFERPTAAHIGAFRSVALDLEPLLKRTLFPVLPGFEKVPRSWPNANDLCIAYVVLCERVRRTMATQSRTARGFKTTELVPDKIASEAKGWLKHASCKLRISFANPVLLCSLLQKFKKVTGGSDVCLLRVLGGLAHLLGADYQYHRPLLCLKAGAGSAAQPTHWTQVPQSLALGLGVYQVAISEIQDRSLRRVNGKRSGLHNVCKGNIVQWKSVHVEVLSIQRHVNVEAVTTTIGMNKWFAVGSDHSHRSAWGACRVLHRSRVLTAPDGCCEAIGSWMRYQWNPRRHSTPRQVADGVFLAQAGVRCIGGRRDEVLIAEVTRILQETSVYDGRSSAKKKALLERHIAEHNLWVRDSGRATYEVPDDEDAPILPNFDLPRLGKGCNARRQWSSHRNRPQADLPHEMRRALKQSVDKDGRMAALQLDAQHLHARQRGATSSVMHERLCNWLRSEAGQAWSKERAKMLQADDSDGGDV